MYEKCYDKSTLYLWGYPMVIIFRLVLKRARSYTRCDIFCLEKYIIPYISMNLRAKQYKNRIWWWKARERDHESIYAPKIPHLHLWGKATSIFQLRMMAYYHQWRISQILTEVLDCKHLCTGFLNALILLLGVSNHSIKRFKYCNN